MARDGLTDVLTALTGYDGPPLSASPWARHDLTICSQAVGACSTIADATIAGVVIPYGARPWTVESPAAAVEVLSERGLWPWAPGDVHAPWWWCDRCARQGWQSDAPVACVCDRSDDAPPSLAALVAVASHGAATLRRVAMLVRELHAATRGETGATLVWRVMTQEALHEHYQRETTTYARQEPFGRYLCKVFAHESFDPAAGHPPWPEASTYARSRTAAAWPMLRALAIHENGTPTGLHLVAADRERVVIAVEAL